MLAYSQFFLLSLAPIFSSADPILFSPSILSLLPALSPLCSPFFMFYLTYASSLLFLLPSPLLFQYLLPNRPYPPSLLCLLIHILFPDPSAPSTHLIPPRPFSPYLESCQRCPEQINSPQRVKIKIPRFHSTPHPPLTTSSLAPDSFKSPRMLTRRVNPAGGPGVTSSRPQDRLRHPLPARHRPFLCKSTQAATTKGPFENLCKSKSRIISNNR